MRIRIALLASMLGCGTRSVSLPDQPDALSVILTVEGEEPDAIAHDLDGPPLALQLSGVSSLEAYFFREPLCALGLLPGKVDRDPRGAKLSPSGLFRREPESEWESLEELDPIGVRRVPPEECVARGGSYSAMNMDRCTTCPMPATAAEPSFELGFDQGECPLAWIERDVPEVDARYRICSPFPQSEIPECTEGTWPFLTSSCEALGPCPTEAVDLDDPTLIWVASTGVAGDGSRANPYATIAEAISDPRDAVIVVEPGTYPERVDVNAGRRVIGICAATTRIVAPVGELALATTSSGSAEDLTLAGPVYASGELVLRRVAIEGSLSVFESLTAERIAVTGVLATDGDSTLDLVDSVVRGQTRFEGEASIRGTLFDGPAACEGAEVELSESMFVAPTSNINLEILSSTVTIELALFTSRADDTFLYQLAAAGSSLTVERSVFETLGGAVKAFDGSSARIEDVLVARTKPENPPLGLIPSFGVSAATLKVNRSVHHGWGEPMAVTSRGTLIVDSTIVRGALTGIRVEMATASIARSLIEDVEFVGVLYERTVESNPISRIEVEDTIVRRSSPCIQIANVGASVARVLLEDCRGAALTMQDATRADLVASDVVIRNVHAVTTNCRECLGIGIDCALGPIEVDRFSIEGADEAGVELGSDCTGRLRDGRVRAAPVGIRASEPPLLERILFEEVEAPYQIGP